MTSDTAWSGLYTGIVSAGNVGSESVTKNKIFGSGLPHDGRAILLDGGGLSPGKLKGNVVDNKSIRPLLATIEVRGYSQSFKVSNNVITRGSGSHGFVIGACLGGVTSGGIVRHNSFSLPRIVDTLFRAIVLRNTRDITLTNNAVFSDLPPALQFPPGS